MKTFEQKIVVLNNGATKQVFTSEIISVIILNNGVTFKKMVEDIKVILNDSIGRNCLNEAKKPGEYFFTDEEVRHGVNAAITDLIVNRRVCSFLKNNTVNYNLTANIRKEDKELVDVEPQKEQPHIQKQFWPFMA